MSFVRKNLLTLSGKFFVPGYDYHPDGDSDQDDVVLPQPSSATCVLTYYAPAPPPICVPGYPPSCPPTPTQLKASFALTLQSDGLTWQGQWDSSVAEGRVDWMIYSSGSVVAAAQGNFVVRANSANITVP